MPYCSNCGHTLQENALFCPNCGFKCNDILTQSLTKGQQNYDQPVRKQTYVGEVRKCPSCGAQIPSFTSNCPECGCELNSLTQAKSITQFATRLNQFDAQYAKNPSQYSGWDKWGIWKKIGWIILNIYTFGIPYLVYRSNHSNGYSEVKASFVQNYVFPNDRESILEALIFVKSQIAQLVAGSITGGAKKWESIWMGKASQLSQKAIATLGNDEIATQTYNDILELHKKFQKRARNKTLIIWLCVIGVIVFSFVFDALMLGQLKR